MSFSFAGIFGGIAIGAVIFLIVYGIFKFKEWENKVLYILSGVVVVITVVLSVLGGYLGRTELIKGDFSFEDCDYIGCSEPAAYEFYYNFSKGYYCEDDVDYCQILTGDIEIQSSDEDSFGHDDIDAWTAAINVVENQLKSPSTAEFCSKSAATIKLSGDTWTISGYVDAQNSFGAVLRNRFTVKITFTSSTKYNIDECNIYE